MATYTIVGQGKKTLYPIYATALFTYYYAMGVYISILSLYLYDIGLSSTEIAFVISSTAIFTIAVQPMLGMIADIIKKIRYVIILSLLITTLATYVFSISHHVFLLFILNGMVQSLIISIMPFFDNMSERSGYGYGRVRLWGSIGFAVSVQITGIMYDHLPRQYVFYIFILMSVISVMMVIQLPELKYSKKEGLPFWPALRKLLIQKQFILFLLISFIILGMHYCNIAYMPLLVSTVGGGATQVGMILLFQTLFEIPILLHADRIIDKLGFKGCLYMIIGLLILRFFWYSSEPNVTWMIAMFFFQALSTCLFFVLSVKIVIYMVDEQLVNSALSMGSMLGKGLGALSFQLIGGQILNFYNVNTIYIFLGIVGLIGIIIASFFKPRAYEGNSN